MRAAASRLLDLVVPTRSQPVGVAVDGGLAYVADETGLSVISLGCLPR